MPNPKKNTYEIGRRKYATFEKSAAAAVDLSLQTGEGVTIVEHGLDGTFHITVTAQAEEAT